MSEEVAAAIRLVIPLLCQALAYAGYIVDADIAYEVVCEIVSLVAFVYAWWKNNNITAAAQKAQEYLDDLKGSSDE